jgi:ATP-dependent DNA ligase
MPKLSFSFSSSVLQDGKVSTMSGMQVEEAESDAESEATSTLLQTFLQEAFSASCEGMMVKALDKDAGYAASKRSDSWLKVTG